VELRVTVDIRPLSHRWIHLLPLVAPKSDVSEVADFHLQKVVIQLLLTTEKLRTLCVRSVG
jgi:hypothetical protein